jgi:Rieske Fe-S protein
MVGNHAVESTQARFNAAPAAGTSGRWFCPCHSPGFDDNTASRGWSPVRALPAKRFALRQAVV